MNNDVGARTNMKLVAVSPRRLLRKPPRKVAASVGISLTDLPGPKCDVENDSWMQEPDFRQ